MILSILKRWKLMIKNQAEITLKFFRTDQDKKFTDTATITAFFQEHDIVHEIVTIYFFFFNGIAERLNWTFFDMIKSIMIKSRLSTSLWVEIIDIIVKTVEK